MRVHTLFNTAFIIIIIPKSLQWNHGFYPVYTQQMSNAKEFTLADLTIGKHFKVANSQTLSKLCLCPLTVEESFAMNARNASHFWWTPNPKQPAVKNNTHDG